MAIHLLSPELLTREVHVAVIGAGGTGSQMLTGLAQLHTSMIALGPPRRPGSHGDGQRPGFGSQCRAADVLSV